MLKENSSWDNKFIDNVAIELKMPSPNLKVFLVRNLIFYNEYKVDEEFVQLVAQLSWKHNVSVKDIANHFKINLDTANNWIKKWIERDFLKRLDNRQIRNVDYILADKYIENLK